MGRGTRYPILAVMALLLGVALAACGSNSAEGPATSAEQTPAVGAAAGFPLTVASDDGRSVMLAKAPERIVSLSPGHTEVLFAIGAGGQVVATDKFSDYPEAVARLPRVDYSNPNVESIVALRPDLVLATTRQRNLVGTFEQAGLRVLLKEEPETVAAVLERIRLLGQVSGHPAQAAEVVTGMEARLAALTAKLVGVTVGPRVYHELDPKLFSAAPNSFVGDLYMLLKAQNIAQGAQTPFPQLSAEAIIAADPEVIVLADADFPGGSPDEVRRRSGWNAVSAVRNGRLYAVDTNLVSRPSPRIVDGLDQLARHLYPALFP